MCGWVCRYRQTACFGKISDCHRPADPGEIRPAVPKTHRGTPYRREAVCVCMCVCVCVVACQVLLPNKALLASRVLLDSLSGAVT